VTKRTKEKSEDKENLEIEEKNVTKKFELA
jgi:hypothetical protein